MATLLRREPAARIFFFAHLQSSLGTGVGYVALLLVAYDRQHGPWGITLVLLADFLPATVFGPLFGALADRWSRRACAVVADLMRAAGLIGIGLVGGIEATIALALLVGFGSGLFQPAILAGLPSLVDRERLPAAMSLYGALREVGATLGPALAAGLLVVVDAKTLVMVDGATFAISALLIAVLPFGKEVAPAEESDGEERASLLREAGDGLRAVRAMPDVVTLIASGAAVLMFAAMLNVVELLYAKNELGVGGSGFSVLIALTGVGIVAGSALAAREGTSRELGRRYVSGLGLSALAVGALAIAPIYALAIVCFIAVGVGNGAVLVNGRVLVHRLVPEHLLGRVFGINDAVGSAAFGIAFLTAGILASTVGVRATLAVAGVGGLIVWGISLRRFADLGSNPPRDVRPAADAAPVIPAD